MASVVPAMRGKFGSTEYYIITMPANELTERLKVPSEIDGWEDLSIQERYQREIQYGRVKRQIAPYLVDDDDRFFGAFIVSMLNADNINFEPISKIYKGSVPQLYESAGDAFGFLVLQGSEVLVPLDGQHRLAALRFAITGKDEKQQPISDLAPRSDVAKDVCTVILIRHDPDKSRKIFNKVNRYAKKTSKAENLITADDDIIAVIVREEILGDDNVIPVPLVNAKSNTLSAKAKEFTTLSTLYEATKDLLEDTHGKINLEILPSKATQGIMKAEAESFWETVCSEIDLFSAALTDPSEQGDRKRQEIRKDFLLGKPIAQWVLASAIIRLRVPDSTTGTRMSLIEACRRMNQLDWSSTAERWQDVLMRGDKILAGRTAVRFASQVVAWWLGEDLTEAEVAQLNERFVSQGGTGSLADPIQLT